MLAFLVRQWRSGMVRRGCFRFAFRFVVFLSCHQFPQALIKRFPRIEVF
jgi:hypothetical protein